MSAAVWIVAAIIAAAVIALVVVLVRRAGHSVPLGEAEAIAAAAALPGFAGRHALIGDDRRTALVVGEHARVALVTRRDRQPIAREVRWSDIRAVNGGLRVEAERVVLIAGVDVLDVRRAGDEGWRRKAL